MRPPAFLIVLASILSAWAPARQATAQASVGWIEIEGALADKPSPFGWLMGEPEPTLLDVVAGIDAAADRDDVDALLLRLREPALTMTQVEEMARAVARVRDAGKPVHLFTEIYGPAELALGAACDEVILQEGGAVSFPGLHVEEMFLADTLAWLGLKMDYVQIGKYKGAEEQLGRSAPSEAWDENISQLLDSLYDAMRAPILAGRGLTERRLDRAMQEAFFASGRRAIDAGLIDAEVDRLDLPAHLEHAYGGAITYRSNLLPDGRSGPGADALANPFAIFQLLASEPDTGPTRPTIAVLDIDGPIVDGESQPAGLLGGASVGSLTIREALKRIEDEPLIKGVVVRINSPGGSAIASESIWLGLRRVAEAKPVWVSVGSMAASGGYYIAVGGEKIYLCPSSIVGSIGVVGGKLVMGGAYQKLSVNVVPRDRGPAAGLMSTLEPWTDSQRELIRERMTETYDLFVSRVQAGRPGIDIDKTAEGRLFAGQRAIEMGLADEIGGLDDAIRDLAARAGLAEGAYDVMHYPGPKSIQELIEESLGGFGLSAPGARGDRGGGLDLAVAAMRELVGPRAWPGLRDAMAALWTLRTEPVTLTAPRVLLRR